MLAKNLLIGALALGATIGYSQGYVSPSVLKTSNDGNGTDVQSELTKMGLTSSVGSGSSYGDQLSGAYFDSTGTMDWSIAYQSTKWSTVHELGYYTNLGSADPTIHWVIGGTSTGLPSSASVNITGEFGLAIQTGNNHIVFGNPQGVLYSNSALNPNGSDQLAIINAVGPKVTSPSLVASWEDTPIVPYPQDKDYNDLGVLMTNCKTVTPEPGVWALMGLGVVGLFVRRKTRRTV